MSTYRVYVIRLRVAVLERKRFAAANPGHLPHKPCVYVGSTAHTPERRLESHLTTKSGSRFVKDFHLKLHARLTARQPTFATREEAVAHEGLLADRLRRKGYAVWAGRLAPVTVARKVTDQSL